MSDVSCFCPRCATVMPASYTFKSQAVDGVDIDICSGCHGVEKKQIAAIGKVTTHPHYWPVRQRNTTVVDVAAWVFLILTGIALLFAFGGGLA